MIIDEKYYINYALTALLLSLLFPIPYVGFFLSLGGAALGSIILLRTFKVKAVSFCTKAFSVLAVIVGIVGLINAVSVFFHTGLKDYVITTSAMEPTIPKGSRILELSHPVTIDYGDIVIYKKPFMARDYESKWLVHRVIGFPGDSVAIKNGKVFINGEEFRDPRLPLNAYYAKVGHYGKKRRVFIGRDRYFFISEDPSQPDSRQWGFVPKRNVKGKVVSIVTPQGEVKKVK